MIQVSWTSVCAHSGQMAQRATDCPSVTKLVLRHSRYEDYRYVLCMDWALVLVGPAVGAVVCTVC